MILNFFYCFLYTSCSLQRIGFVLMRFEPQVDRFELTIINLFIFYTYFPMIQLLYTKILLSFWILKLCTLMLLKAFRRIIVLLDIRNMHCILDYFVLLWWLLISIILIFLDQVGLINTSTNSLISTTVLLPDQYALYYIINIFQMLSKADKYIQMIKDRTQRIILFPHMDNKGNKSIFALQCNIKLPSSHTFRSSQQIEKNTSITHQITHQSSKWCHTELHNNSCIGLVLCEHHQNHQTFYVYGTGTLIHNNIVLTSAQNVYCRRLNTQYTNIRFIVGVNGDKCSGIYDVVKVYYPKEYIMQLEYENYNFAVLQLYDDLSNSCGYAGWKTIGDIKEVEKYTEYGYISDNQSFKLRSINKQEKLQQDQYISGSSVSIKENQNKYSIVGLKGSSDKNDFIILSEQIRKIINQWIHLTTITLYYNQIDTQGCKYLSQANCTNLIRINLDTNNIGAQGCKYLSQANWIHLRYINLYYNKIDAQGCKYLSQTNWVHLRQIYLINNYINAQGCKYLSQTNWTHLRYIHLADNDIEDIFSRIFLLELYLTATIVI